MKSLIRIIVPLLAAALFLPIPALAAPHQPVASAQDQDQQNRGGMGGFQFEEHSVRGDITAIAGNTITVKTDEGDVYSVATGPNTRFRKQADQIKVTDLHVGDMIAAIGDKDPKAKTLGAMFVVVIDKEQYAKARADFGKTWTAGAVQSIDGTNIVIKRPDNVTQTVSVDENTSFRRRREDITLLDIKPGDNITARGALQKGSFLATMVNIGGPRGFGGGGAGDRSRPDANSTPNSPAAPSSNPRGNQPNNQPSSQSNTQPNN
jgi:hypothetical protein